MSNSHRPGTVHDLRAPLDRSFAFACLSRRASVSAGEVRHVSVSSDSYPSDETRRHSAIKEAGRNSFRIVRSARQGHSRQRSSPLCPARGQRQESGDNVWPRALGFKNLWRIRSALSLAVMRSKLLMCPAQVAGWHLSSPTAPTRRQLE